MRLEKLRYKKEQSDYDWNFLMAQQQKKNKITNKKVYTQNCLFIWFVSLRWKNSSFSQYCSFNCSDQKNSFKRLPVLALYYVTTTIIALLTECIEIKKKGWYIKSRTGGKSKCALTSRRVQNEKKEQITEFRKYITHTAAMVFVKRSK